MGLGIFSGITGSGDGSGGGGGGGTPSAPFNSIQFNNAGAFGGSAGFTRDLVTGVVTITISNSLMYFDPVHGYGLTILAAELVNDNTGIDVVASSPAAGNSSSIYGITAQVDWESSGVLTEGCAIQIISPGNGGGGSATNFKGLDIQDQTGATNNWAIKTGAGMVEIGDATKVTGIHVRGAGDFVSVSQSQLWLDGDNASAANLIFTNRTFDSTATAPFTFNMNDVGDFSFYQTAGTGYLNFTSDGLKIVVNGASFVLNADVTLPFVMKKNTQAATAPGAGFACLRFEADTGGTAKLVAYAGTSVTPTVIASLIGGGF